MARGRRRIGAGPVAPDHGLQSYGIRGKGPTPLHGVRSSHPARIPKATFDEADRARLLADAGIIRNRLKVKAAIENARRLQGIRADRGSFAAWLDAHHPLDREGWRKLFKQHFVFTGGEIVNEFLMSTGYLPGAHDPDCPVYARILALDPPWRRPEA